MDNLLSKPPESKNGFPKRRCDIDTRYCPPARPGIVTFLSQRGGGERLLRPHSCTEFTEFFAEVGPLQVQPEKDCVLKQRRWLVQKSQRQRWPRRGQQGVILIRSDAMERILVLLKWVDVGKWVKVKILKTFNTYTSTSYCWSIMPITVLRTIESTQRIVSRGAIWVLDFEKPSWLWVENRLV